MRERDLRQVIMKHMEAEDAEVEAVEGIGALNFLQIDDIPICKEGEIIDPNSIIMLPTHLDLPTLPEISSSPAIIRSVVDFPQPDSPIIAIRDPGFSSKERSLINTLSACASVKCSARKVKSVGSRCLSLASTGIRSNGKS